MDFFGGNLALIPYLTQYGAIYGFVVEGNGNLGKNTLGLQRR